MDERAAGATTDSTVVSEAYSTARELLCRAEEDASRIRADADRYKRQREQEAELLVAKARRVLTMAEARAATLRPVVIDLRASAEVTEEKVPDEPRARDGIDLVALEGQAAPRVQTEFDSLLANAVSNAIHRALPSDR
jgi:hypothetical protein